jgi:addiction module HigA family antidote
MSRPLWRVARRKLDQLDSVESLDELKVPPGNRRDEYSIRINGQYRVCFKWATSGSQDVEVTDYHGRHNMIRIPTHRPPTHPVEMLQAEFLAPMHVTQRELADAIHVPYQRVNELVNQKRGVTPSTALRLSKCFSVSADFWLNLQTRFDLFKAQLAEQADLDSIQDVHHAHRNRA